MPLRAGSSPTTSRKTASQTARPPYGLSFALEDLFEVKAWAERSKLSVSIVLDHVIGGVEFEEVVIVASADARERILTLWHAGDAILAQVPEGRPRACKTMTQALQTARTKRQEHHPWRRFLS